MPFRLFKTPEQKIADETTKRDRARVTAWRNAETLFKDGYKFVPDRCQRKGRFSVWKPRALRAAYTIDFWQTGDENQPLVYRCGCRFYCDEERLEGIGWCKHGEGFLLHILPVMELVLVAFDAPFVVARPARVDTDRYGRVTPVWDGRYSK